MEKSYYVATILFGWIILLAIATFSIIAFKIGYFIIGLIFILITIASIIMNLLFIRKWFKKQHV
ncbi:hypothetical protein [Heyndrickxia vini]|uniref:NADH dehydrogenase subunit 1 n=1 Tax=Heyndrickxia vini TaxID=1476025 RepID=A0ABX7DXP0_9BACI|nr:hypothetical protein [Heyndrickxia vini]QQZ07825.1 hypothetical protein I5776_12050 [Heyndrickxia vini]